MSFEEFLHSRLSLLGARAHACETDEVSEHINDAESLLLKAHQKEVEAARVDENESLLSVAEHEIGLPSHCEMHDKYSSYCHACKKRKWYGEISKDWKRIIEVRIEELAALQSSKEEK